MSKNLSLIVADLLAKTAPGTAPSSQIQRLGDELRKAIESEDTIFGTFRGLLGSFRTIIPDEKQRYQAALQALSTTSKLSRQEIIKALSGQLEELKIAEKDVMPSLPPWRDELKGMEARSQQVKGEIAHLRDRLAQLENEDKTIQAGMSTRLKELEAAEKAVKELFANIGAEISALHKMVEELTTEAPAAQPVPPTAPPKRDVPAAKKGGGEETVVIQGAAVTAETKYQRKCPMCGGPFNLLELEKKWQCFTCAYEEPAQG